MEKEQIIAWLRSFEGRAAERVETGDYVAGSTSHGEDLQQAAWFSAAADRIEAGEHLCP